MTPEICNNVSAIDIPEPLIDIRDNKTYQVTKLKMSPDGSQATCWMTQNLALNLSTSQPLTSENTDLNTIAIYAPTTFGVLGTASGGRLPMFIEFDDGAVVEYNSIMTFAKVANNDTLTNNSICPAKWKLPNRDEFLALSTGIIGDKTIAPYNFISGQSYYIPSLYYTDNCGANSSDYFIVDTMTVRSGACPHNLFPIRCVIR